MDTKENPELTEAQKIFTIEKIYFCNKCGKSFPWNSSLLKQQRVHSGEEHSGCTVCGRCFPELSSSLCIKEVTVARTLHMERLWENLHSEHERYCSSKNSPGQRPYLCGECGKASRKNSALVNMKGFTLERNPTYAMTAVELLPHV